IWSKNLKQRRIAFWNYFNNQQKYQLYTRWVNSEPPIVPNTFKICLNPQETDIEHSLRKTHANRTFQFHIDLHEAKATRFRQQQQQIDAQHEQFLSTVATGAVFIQLLNLWNKDCLRNEQTSLKIWEKHEHHYRKYEEAIDNRQDPWIIIKSDNRPKFP
ncbi:unnamed protein product, partial [Didymodactylos carnosus]